MTNLFVDMDGVITDYLESAIEFIEYNYSVDQRFKKEDIKQYMVPLNYGYDINVSIKIINKMHSYQGFFRDMAPIEGSILSLKKINGSGKYKIYITTKPTYNANCILEKIEWLKIHLPFIDENNYVFLSDKGILSKGILIDDYISNIKNYKYDAIFFLQPYNEDEGVDYAISENGRVRVASNWDAIKKALI